MSHHILLNFHAINANLKDAGWEGAKVDHNTPIVRANKEGDLFMRPYDVVVLLACFRRPSQLSKAAHKTKKSMGPAKIIVNDSIAKKLQNFYALRESELPGKSDVLLHTWGGVELQRVPGLKERLALAMSHSNKTAKGVYSVEKDHRVLIQPKPSIKTLTHPASNMLCSREKKRTLINISVKKDYRQPKKFLAINLCENYSFENVHTPTKNLV
ncbi:unnamed protein product [Lepeophtheirus salmonis]|uniref:(salmon louse) hypothetical protein n=1 Tax=Lepeophtheirus salmonis TaxID=72036 RepID=A0A817FC63_LEPSM|nr:unnamed protein product [Lepeophtheirus salmonis]